MFADFNELLYFPTVVSTPKLSLVFDTISVNHYAAFSLNRIRQKYETQIRLEVTDFVTGFVPFTRIVRRKSLTKTMAQFQLADPLLINMNYD